MFMQFKAFSLGATLRVVNPVVKDIARGDFHGAGIGHLIAMGLLMGYVSTSAKQFVRTGSIPDPTDPATWARSFAQFGGLGIYGDFLMGDFNRYGNGALATLGGPAVGEFETLLGLFSAIRDGDKAGAKTFRFLLGNTPLANLFYAKPALDFLFVDAVNEALSPGYRRRIKKRLEKEGATFVFGQ